jgi:hypothetical protein
MDACFLIIYTRKVITALVKKWKMEKHMYMHYLSFHVGKLYINNIILFSYIGMSYRQNYGVYISLG